LELRTSTVFGPAAKGILELRTKSTALSRREQLRIYQPKQHKRTVFSSARNFLEFVNKNNSNWLHVVQSAATIFGIATKSTVFCALKFLEERTKKSIAFCSAAQRKFLNCEPKHCILLRRAAKILEFSHNTNQTDAFVLPRSHKFRNLPTEATHELLTEFCLAAQRKFWN
jgi:hypothetical protein